MKYFTKKNLLPALVLAALLFFLVLPMAFQSFVTTFESPDVVIHSVKAPNAEEFVWDEPEFSGKFSGSPVLNIQVGQPQEADCLNRKLFGQSKLCLIKDDIVDSFRSGDDKVEQHRYTYRFYVFYQAVSRNFAEELFGSSVTNYEITFDLDYKDQPVEFKSLSVKQFLRCSEGSRCDEVALGEVDGFSFGLRNDYTRFQTNILKLPVNTDTTQIMELVIDSDKRLENFYFESENPPVTEDALDFLRQEGSVEDLANFLGTAGIILVIIVLILGSVFVVVVVKMYLGGKR